MGMTSDSLSYWLAETEVIDLLGTTIGDLLDCRSDELLTQEAVVSSWYPEFGEALNVRWPYQEYRERANAVAKGLLALGLRKGDHRHSDPASLLPIQAGPLLQPFPSHDSG
jgi:fatty-acyl-CoA synthase